jgi:hypothetical protein
MVRRRNFLKLCAGTAMVQLVPGIGVANSRPVSKCRPAISGTLWWCSPEQNRKWGASGWMKEVQEQQGLGFDLLWLVQGPQLLRNDFSLRQLLDLCAQRKIQVIVDTGLSSHWYAPLDLKTELELCRSNITAVGEQLAGHPAFYAWYVPHEIYMDWGAMHQYVSQLYPALVAACKKAAPLPVTLSPFFILDRTKVFGDFRFNEPDEYREYWRKLIRASGIDIIMMQDSGEHFSYVQDEQRWPFFEAMSGACRDSGARFWANVEVAEMNCPSIEEYVRLYGRVHHSVAKGIPWRPVPIERLRTKLKLAAEYAERIVSWGYQEFCRPGLGEAALNWCTSYRAYRHECLNESRR